MVADRCKLQQQFRKPYCKFQKQRQIRIRQTERAGLVEPESHPSRCDLQLSATIDYLFNHKFLFMVFKGTDTTTSIPLPVHQTHDTFYDLVCSQCTDVFMTSCFHSCPCKCLWVFASFLKIDEIRTDRWHLNSPRWCPWFHPGSCMISILSFCCCPGCMRGCWSTILSTGWGQVEDWSTFWRAIAPVWGSTEPCCPSSTSLLVRRRQNPQSLRRHRRLHAGSIRAT